MLFALIAAYGAWNGRQWGRFQETTLAELAQADAKRLGALDSLLLRAEQDSTVLLPPAGALGASFATRHAVLPVPALAVLAVGASDLHPYYARVSVRSKASFMASDEVENPHNLLAGRFDLVFVVVWVLPLLLIALTYNTVTGERDQGTMALWRAQPVPATRVLLAKLGVRAVFVLGLARPRRDAVDVQVQGSRVDGEVRDAGLLDALEQGDAREVRLAVAVSAELQPSSELAVVGQQHPFARVVHDDGGGGQVPGEVRAQVRRGRMRVDPGHDAVGVR